MKTDTIAAIATAVSDSGLGIIRISGDEAIVLADKVYQSKSGKKRLQNVGSHTIHYGFIYDGDVLIDEVMVAVMRAPNTYTREDTVEIDCHGGILVMQKILSVLLKNGCRLAQPGEFTKRAFLNGRIDLSRAEAVMDLIHARNTFALQSSVRQLHGVLSDRIRMLRENILYEIAFIESALDDPEHISLDGYPAQLAQKAEEMVQIIKKLLDSSDSGKMLKDGINTVIVGKPNAGKSSLLNLLVGEDRAIVTSVAGTTRDVLEESVNFEGIGLNVIDTAGIRHTEDEVERIGVDKARKYAQNADLIVYVVDASCVLDTNDEEIMKLITDKKVIVLLNKTDLVSVVSKEDILNKMKGLSEKGNIRIIKTSTKENIGMDVFEKTVKEMFFGGEISVKDEIYVTNLRHQEALAEAYESMQMVLKSIQEQMPEDFYSIDLMSAYAALGKIIGEEVGEDLVNEIFGKFCVGK